MNNILKVLDYFFNPIVGSKFHYYVPLLVIAGLLIVSGIALKFYMGRHVAEKKTFKKLFHHVPYHFFWIAAFFLANVFGRYEGFPLLGARFVLYIISLALIYVIGKNIYIYVKIYRTEKTKFRETPAGKKYTIGKHAHR